MLLVNAFPTLPQYQTAGSLPSKEGDLYLLFRQNLPISVCMLMSIVYMSPGCLRDVPGYLSSKHNNNRCLQLSLSLPPTTLQAFALCLGWQQCKVNRMNKTYLNQNPLPWEMSSCQYSLMGNHRTFPRGRTVYCVASTKIQSGQLVSLCTKNARTLDLLELTIISFSCMSAGDILLLENLDIQGSPGLFQA